VQSSSVLSFSIAGRIPVSFLDWPGKLAYVVFSQGCNLSCPFCHNHGLIETKPSCLSVEDIVGDIRASGWGWIDGIVISGGEPAFQGEALAAFCSDLKKSLGLPIKLDTNGMYPEIVETLIDKSLVDFVALDIKAPWDVVKYSRAAGRILDEYAINKIKRTFGLLLAGKIPHLIRTTVVPGLHTFSDIEEIWGYTRKADRYVLQDFCSEHALDVKLREEKGYGLEVLDAWTSRLENKNGSYCL